MTDSDRYTDNHSGTTRRRLCARCTRPATACICGWVRPLVTAVDLVILQHPMEVSNAKGSARLLHLSVAHSKLIVGETFEPGMLAAVLGEGGRTPVLLYPPTPDDVSLGIPSPPPLAGGMAPSALRLVVLDGTWRKSRKMLYLNPLLQALPRLALSGMGASNYRIRKAHAPDQLSTLEAACHALAQMEGERGKFDKLSASFADFVDAFARNQGKLQPPLENPVAPT